MTTQIFYTKEFNMHNNSSHPENAKRLDIMIKAIKNSPIYDKLDFVKPEIIPEKMLHDVHSDRMIKQVKDMSKRGGAWIDLDTYVCSESYRLARLAAGGVLKACENVLQEKTDNAYALVRPPGHHATKTRSMGFCLFNNTAIAANEISKQNKKTLICDFDIHHGNGTQDIFYDRKDVLYQSLHLSPHFPGTGDISEIGIDKGKGYNINAPLSFGYGDKAALKILDQVFLPIAEQFQPDLVMFSVGYDSHHSDVLGGLKFTTDFYKKIIERYKKIQPKIVCALEGGYHPEWIRKCFLTQLGVMTDSKIFFKDKAYAKKDSTPVIKELKKELKKYWDF